MYYVTPSLITISVSKILVSKSYKEMVTVLDIDKSVINCIGSLYDQSMFSVLVTSQRNHERSIQH